jgi:hypothetical protein
VLATDVAQLAELQFPVLWDAINDETGPETLRAPRGTVLLSPDFGCRRCSSLPSDDDQAAKAPTVPASLARRQHPIDSSAGSPRRSTPTLDPGASWNPLITLAFVVLSRSQQSEVETVFSDIHVYGFVLEPRWPRDGRHTWLDEPAFNSEAHH